MALIRALTGGGGGTPTETILWENPTPTSNFTGATVSLNNSYTNYDEIRVYTRYSTTDSTERYVAVSTTDASGSQYTNRELCCPDAMLNGAGFTRTVQYISTSPTSVLITRSLAINGKNGADNLCIPTKITGVKY